MSVPALVQQVRFCEAPDGVRIAYAVSGTGPPLLVSTCWLSHLQHDWESPVWRHFLEQVGEFATMVRYDERGHGRHPAELDQEVPPHRALPVVLEVAQPAGVDDQRRAFAVGGVRDADTIGRTAEPDLVRLSTCARHSGNVLPETHSGTAMKSAMARWSQL